MAEPKKEKKSIFDKAVDMVTDRDEKQAAAAAATAAAQSTANEIAALKTSLSQEQALRRQWEQKAAASEQKAAAAQKEADAAKQALVEAQKTLSGSKTAASTVEAQLAAAVSRANAAEAKARQLEEQVRTLQAQGQQRAQEQAAARLRKHKVVSGETLSGLALKYYGSAAREKWMIIYDANKAVIGDNPNLIRAGTELVIPED